MATYFSAAAAAHAADPSASDWSGPSENEIRKRVAAQTPAFTVDRIDCRRRTCRVQIRAQGLAEDSGAWEGLVGSLAAKFPDVSIDRQPSGVVTLYLSRPPPGLEDSYAHD